MQRLADFVVRWPWVVIGLWVAIAVALPLTFPSLNEMAQKHPLSILPGDAPSSITARKMTEAFHESGSEDLLLVVLTDDKGLGPADEAAYRKLVDELRQDTRDVLMLQDFVSTPSLRPALTSKDHKSWVLPVGIAGELGTPRSDAAYTRVAGVVKQTLEHTPVATPLTANLTGPAATVADLQAQLDTFTEYYNTVRPHRSCHRRTPDDAHRSRPPAGPADTPAGIHWRVRTDHVDSYGKITLRHAGHLHHIGIGHHWANTAVLMLIADLNIRIIATANGQLIRELTLDTNRDYQPQNPKTPPADN